MTDKEKEALKKNSKWWQDRLGESQQKLTNKSIKETEAQLVKYYQKTMNTVIDDFEKTYLKYLEAVANKKEPTPADLYKLDKYWQMQSAMSKELEKLGDKQARLLSKQFEAQYHSIYNSIALKDLGGQFSTLDTEVVNQVLNSIWCADGKSWSDRVWNNTAKLKQALNDNLIDCVVSGRKSTDLKKLLIEEFEVSYHRAESIVRTEMAHIQTEAAKQRYLASGITEVEVWADYDDRRCDICGKLHETRHPINGVMPVPAHPNCRCTIIPVVQPNNQLMVI